MKILFVCKYNAFRSRIAEEYFKKINKNPKIESYSRGIIMGGDSDNVQRGIARELLGVNIAKRKPLPLNIEEMKKTDKIIVVADDVPLIVFNYHLIPIWKRVKIWKIKDEQKRNKKNIKQIALQIKERVEKLNEELK